MRRTTSIALGSGRTRRREPHCLCSYRHNRGSTVCVNSRRVRVDEIDRRVLSAIERTVLTPVAVNYVVDQVVERILAARRTAPDRCKEIDAELKRLRRELDRFVSLIANDKAPERVLDEISGRECRLRELEAELAHLQLAPPTRLQVAGIRELALARAKDLHSTLYADVGRARQALQQLLVGPITFTPGESGYRLERQTRVGPLFSNESSITRISVDSDCGIRTPVTAVKGRCPRPLDDGDCARNWIPRD